jgi:cyclic beta-1,2-glucan synthetase
VSESLYVDELTKKYEYKPIGISTLSRDPLQIQRTTITPYATSLMCLIDSKKAIANLKALEALNSLTEYGFFESMTFSKASEHLEIDSFMSHHQGMIMASLTNVLMPDILVKLFNSYSTFETVDYLLDEDIPYYPEIINVKALKFSIDED